LHGGWCVPQLNVRVLFAAEVCEALSWAGMFLFWVLMMDGLKAKSFRFCRFYLPKVRNMVVVAWALILCVSHV